MEPVYFPMMKTTHFVNEINSCGKNDSILQSWVRHLIDLWRVVLAALWRCGSCTPEGLPHPFLHCRSVQRLYPSLSFHHAWFSSVQQHRWLARHLKLLLLLIRFSQEQHFLSILSWLCFTVPWHLWEWCLWHIWGGERSVSSESCFDIIACHHGQPTRAGHSRVTVGVFAYCLISDAVFSKVCIWGNPKAVFSNG